MVRLIPINIKPVVILLLFLLPSLSLLNPFTKQSMPKVMVTIRPIIMSIGVNASSHPRMLLPATTIKKPRPKSRVPCFGKSHVGDPKHIWSLKQML